MKYDGPPKPPERHRLDDERKSLTTKITIHGTEKQKLKSWEFYVTVGLYPNGMPGEIFVKVENIGGRFGALLDGWCVMISLGLQCGMPISVVIDKFRNWRFEPSGMTNIEGIKFAHSPFDCIVRWLEIKFISGEKES